MKNQKAIIIALAIFLILILSVFLVKGMTPSDTKLADQNEQSNTTKEATTGEATPSATTQNKTLADLLKLGTTQKCSFSNSTDKTTTTGTTYISGTKMRGDFEITLDDDKKMQSHMITDGGWVYTWTSAAPQGLKMQIDAADAAKANTDPTKIKGLENLQEKMNFNCTPWIADTTMFDLPTDVQFTDFTQSLKDITSGSTGSACSACDLIQDTDAKSTCKTTLSCK